MGLNRDLDEFGFVQTRAQETGAKVPTLQDAISLFMRRGLSRG